MPLTVRTGSAVPRDARLNRAATAAVFALCGLAFGAWTGRIHNVKHDLGLSDGELGLVLFVGAVGSLIGMQFVPRVLARWGSPRVTTAAIVFFCLSIVPLPLAPSEYTLMAALALVNCAMGFLDVTMNSHAVEVEKSYGRTIMSSFHAFFSVGLMIGTGIAGIAAALGTTPTQSIVTTGFVLAALAVLVTRGLSGGVVPGRGETSAAGAPEARRPLPRLLVTALGLMAFVCLMTEGTTNDWSAVLLHEDRGLGQGAAVAGLVGFNATMTLGRLVGDRVTNAWGYGRTLRRGTALACVGMLAGLAIPGPAAAIVGFVLLGVGLSVSVPILFSVAGSIPGGRPGQGIARVSTLGYLGFLFGPTVIGAIAQASSLALGLAVAMVLLAPVALGAPFATRTQRQPVDLDVPREPVPA